MALMLSLHALNVSVHPIETAFPSRDMVLDPSVCLLQGARLDCAGPDATGFLGTDKPALLQHANML
jgi:hypothetical protein